MLELNQDLINCCRVCRHPNQDGDYECLYQPTPSIDDTTNIPALSSSGLLFEELFWELPEDKYGIYPKFLCNSCDLQMKLFKKLRDKALKTLDYLTELSQEKEQQVLANEYDNLPKEATTIEADNQPLSAQLLSNQPLPVQLVNNYEATISYRLPETPAIQYSNQISLSNLPYVVQAHPEYESAETFSASTAESVLHPELEPIQQETEAVASDSASQFNLAPSENERDDSEEQIPQIDKSDYVLEIYELLDDGNKTETQSVNLEETPKIEDALCELQDYNRDDACSETQASSIDFESYEELFPGDDEAMNKKKRLSRKRRFVNSGRKRQLKCTQCDDEFLSSKDFKYHKDYVHEQVYTCSVCSKNFKTAHTLNTHMKIHDEVPAFQCDICQRTFSQKVHYQYHMNRHNNVRNYRCEYCGTAFIARADLNIHMRQHTGERPHVCPECGKSYMQAEHLKSHMLTHTDQQFPCEVCLQNFSTPKTLRLHMQTIHSDKRFKCRFCLKQFRRKHHLENHMKQLHPSTDFLAESLREIMEEEQERRNLEDDIEVDDDENGEYNSDPGFVALSDDVIIM